MKNLIIFILLCVSILSCKTADMTMEKNTSSELKTAYYEATSIEGVNLNNKKVSIFLNTDEKAISGNATCNDYRFEYEIVDKKIKMNQGISTKMYCDGKMEIERGFMQQVGNVKYISQTDDSLYLKDDENKLLIKAKKTQR